MAGGVPVRPDARVILALGGHEFTRRRGNEAIVAYMLALAPANPRVCLLPTASGDAADQIAAFRDLFRGHAADVSHVSLFRLEHERLALREHLLAQDLIYVGGGSMVNLLAIWNAHGVAEILLEAWRCGAVLAGQSAGAMCWFEHGISRSAGGASIVAGLGVVEGTLSVHYHRDPDRRDALLQAVRAGHRPGLRRRRRRRPADPRPQGRRRGQRRRGRERLAGRAPARTASRSRSTSTRRRCRAPVRRSTTSPPR